jgi:hypothetical protein
MIKTLKELRRLFEQNDAVAQQKAYRKKQTFKPVLGEPHGVGSPNALSTGHKVLDEWRKPSKGLGPRHNPRRNVFKSELDSGSRNWGGNQSMRPTRYGNKPTNAKRGFTEEASEEEQVNKSGKTLTKQPATPVEVEPSKRELTGPTR